MRTSTRRIRALALPVVLGLALTACGPDREAEIAMRATALDLQFARPDLAVPVPPKIIVRLLPAPPVVLDRITDPSAPPLPVPTQAPPVAPVGCPPAGTPGRPGTPLVESTLGAPAPGLYTFDTKGTGTVSGGVDSVSAALPLSTFSTVSAPRQVDPSDTVDLEGGAPASGKQTQYTVTTRLSDKVTQTDVLRVSATSINLVSRTLENAERTFEIKPSPQVQLMVFGPVGTRWSSRGTDQDTTSTLEYSGSIDAETEVTVCGVTTKAYTVSYSSTLTNPPGYEVVRTGTDATHPASFTIAPQLGGLVLAEKVYTEDVRLYSNLSGYVGTTLDYSRMLTDLTPSAP